MVFLKEEIASILYQFNPWWKSESIPDLPSWQRVVFKEMMRWIQDPPVHRALLLSGPRQVGKTTLLLQAIECLLQSGVPKANILYVTFDHPILKSATLESVIEAWRELEPKAEGLEYIFLDEAQVIPNIGTWIKHQVDFCKYRKIIFTGSATPLIEFNHESGVGRWHSLSIAPLSFYEYLKIKNISDSSFVKVSHFSHVAECSSHERLQLAEYTQFLVGHFYEYVVRGGFPQTSVLASVTQAQKLLREDILEKILKRDMTSFFGIRRVVELEQLFLYLCMHDGGLQDLTTISKELGIAKQTVRSFIAHLESVHLVYQLLPYGYGKEILRGKNKVYLADPALAPALLLKGKSILEDATLLGQAVETTVVDHLWVHSTAIQARLSYWRNIKDKEVDILMEMGQDIIPFEIKYQSQPIESKHLVGLLDLCSNKESIKRAYVLTKSPRDIGFLNLPLNAPVIQVPAPLFCFLLGSWEYSQEDVF